MVSFPFAWNQVSIAVKRRNNFLRRLFIAPTVLFALLLGCALHQGSGVIIAQQPTPADSAAKKGPQKVDKNQKDYTAEQVAESSIYLYGSRDLLKSIRRNGVERGRICKPTCEAGKTEEATYERRFVRGESMDKDKIRLDQKMPTLEYSLIYGDGRLWGHYQRLRFHAETGRYQFVSLTTSA